MVTTIWGRKKNCRTVPLNRCEYAHKKKNFLESLGIERTDLLVLFRPPARPNIFLQTRSANLARLADPDKAVSFLLPFMCDKKELKVQLFARTREQANLLCKIFLMNTESIQSCSLKVNSFVRRLLV